MKALLYEFGHTNPDAFTDQKVEFLTNKAADLRQMQGRYDELVKGDVRLANLMPQISAAMEDGRFDDAESLLEDAEDIQNDKALDEIRKSGNLQICGWSVGGLHCFEAM